MLAAVHLDRDAGRAARKIDNAKSTMKPFTANCRVKRGR
jgi:hypothetical protein